MCQSHQQCANWWSAEALRGYKAKCITLLLSVAHGHRITNQLMHAMAGLLCPGGATGQEYPIETLSGYWRSVNTSARAYRCLHEANCQGQPSSSGILAGDASCQPGYRGPFCDACVDGYFKFGANCKYESSLQASGGLTCSRSA